MCFLFFFYLLPFNVLLFSYINYFVNNLSDAYVDFSLYVCSVKECIISIDYFITVYKYVGFKSLSTISFVIFYMAY